MNNSAKNSRLLQTALCLLAAVCAVVLSVLLVLSNRRDSRELSSLRREAEETTASWKQINDDKVALKKTLKRLENDIASAQKDIEDTGRLPEKEARIASLKAELESLQAELDQLDSGDSN